MVKPNRIEDKDLREAVAQIARSVDEIRQKVNHANMKLDHLIQTYRADRYAFGQSRTTDDFDPVDDEQ